MSDTKADRTTVPNYAPAQVVLFLRYLPAAMELTVDLLEQIRKQIDWACSDTTAGTVERDGKLLNIPSVQRMVDRLVAGQAEYGNTMYGWDRSRCVDEALEEAWDLIIYFHAAIVNEMLAISAERRQDEQAP